MKVVLKLGLLTFLTCAVAACEEKNEVKKTQQAVENVVVAEKANSDTIADQISERSYSLSLEGKRFEVNIVRSPNRELPVVKDVLDTPFYDNVVKVTVRHAGQLIFDHVFRKADFDAFLSQEDRMHGTLAGMNIYEEQCTPDVLVFVSQICMSGMDGGTFVKILFSVNQRKYTMQTDDTANLEVASMSQDEGV
ncbi:MAG: DUF4738 domain-containing protein [Bacteroidaceae bacterium]|nr:DUF4738 domain-containing protein [Bacteroidaceae bacterium]